MRWRRLFEFELRRLCIQLSGLPNRRIEATTRLHGLDWPGRRGAFPAPQLPHDSCGPDACISVAGQRQVTHQVSLRRYSDDRDVLVSNALVIDDEAGTCSHVDRPGAIRGHLWVRRTVLVGPHHSTPAQIAIERRRVPRYVRGRIGGIDQDFGLCDRSGNIIALQLEATAPLVGQQTGIARYREIEQASPLQRQQLFDVNDWRTKGNSFETRVVILDQFSVRLRGETSELNN